MYVCSVYTRRSASHMASFMDYCFNAQRSLVHIICFDGQSVKHFVGIIISST